jgi:hypothetical protein
MMIEKTKQMRGASGRKTRGWKPLQPAGEDACPTACADILRETKGRMFAA